jgi:hypothetical protein
MLVGTGLSTSLKSALSTSTKDALLSVSGSDALLGSFSTTIAYIDQFTSTYSSTNMFMSLSTSSSSDSSVAVLNITQALAASGVKLFAGWSNTSGTVTVINATSKNATTAARRLPFFPQFTLPYRNLQLSNVSSTAANESSALGANTTYICGNTTAIPDYNSSASTSNLAVLYVTITLDADLTTNLTLSPSELAALMTSYLTTSPSSPITEFTTTFLMCTGNPFNELLTLGNVAGAYVPLPASTSVGVYSPSPDVPSSTAPLPSAIIGGVVGAIGVGVLGYLACTCCSSAAALRRKTTRASKEVDTKIEGDKQRALAAAPPTTPQPKHPPIPAWGDGDWPSVLPNNPLQSLPRGAVSPSPATKRCAALLTPATKSTPAPALPDTDRPYLPPSSPTLRLRQSALKTPSTFYPATPTLRQRQQSAFKTPIAAANTPVRQKTVSTSVRAGTRYLAPTSAYEHTLPSAVGIRNPVATKGDGSLGPSGDGAADSSAVLLSVVNSSLVSLPRPEGCVDPPNTPSTKLFNDPNTSFEMPAPLQSVSTIAPAMAPSPSLDIMEPREAAFYEKESNVFSPSPNLSVYTFSPNGGAGGDILSPNNVAVNLDEYLSPSSKD